MPELADSLPRLYRSLLPDTLRGWVADETKATCGRCTMLASNASAQRSNGASHRFHPSTKCCTYHPKLPNYLVGALLSDPDPKMQVGQRRVQERIALGHSATPQWLRTPAKYEVLYNSGRDVFGRAPSLKCPYYDSDVGGCSIWAYREAVCSTYFCQYVAGADGLNYWMSVKTYLGLVERVLSQYALYTLDPKLGLASMQARQRTAGSLTLAELEELAMDEADRRALWGEWVGREMELYRETYAIVAALDQDGLSKLLGFEGSILARAVTDCLDRANDARLPAYLQLNPNVTVRYLDDGSVGLASYSEFDAVALPRAALPLLAEFDGKRPATSVRQALREQQETDFDDDILLILMRQRILLGSDHAKA